MNVEKWLEWCKVYEPEAFTNVVVNTALELIYNEALEECKGVKKYMRETNFEVLVYNLALHNLIMYNSETLPEPLNTLYEKYQVANNTGMLESVTDASSSASKFVSDGIRQGDAQSMLLWSTTYGQKVESILEQLKGIVVCV